MYGYNFNGPFISPMMPYNLPVRSALPMRGLSGSLLKGGVSPIKGNALAGNGILSSIKNINYQGVLGNISKTLGVVKEAIPVVKEVGPMVNNMRSMLKIASVFNDVTDTNTSSTKNSITDNKPSNINSNNIDNNDNTNSNNEIIHNIKTNDNEPNFFL